VQVESKGYNQNTDYLKIISIGCLCIFIFAVIAARNAPATGYEASIYTATPVIFWLSTALNVIWGTFLIVRQISTQQHLKSSFWFIGFFFIFLAFFSLVALWMVRGYAAPSNGDILTHVGLTNYITTFHHYSPGNYYPITHLFTAEMSFILAIPVRDLFGYIPLIFNVVFIIFIYLFSKEMISSGKASAGVAILVVATGTLFFTNFFAPNNLADLFLAFALYLFVKSSQSGTRPWKILFILVVFMYPPFHPVPSLALLLIMITVTLPNMLLAILKRQGLHSLQGSFTFKYPVILFLLAWSVFWFSTTAMWRWTVDNLWAYFSNGGINQLTTLSQQVQYAQQYQYSIIEQFLKLYGGLILFALIALIILPAIIKKASYTVEHRNFLSLYGSLPVILLFIFIFYFLNLVFNPLRLTMFIMLICMVLTGFGLNTFLEQPYTKASNNFYSWISTCLVSIIIILALVSSGLQAYPSRYIKAPNDQITMTDLQGMDWFLHFRNTSYQISAVNLVPYRFSDYLLSPQEDLDRENLTPILIKPKEDQKVPWHFGYDEINQFGGWFTHKAYLVIDQADRVLYQEIYPEMQSIRLTPADFDRLNQDTSLQRLFSNGGLDVYSVTPLSTSP
jgi:hypothetical protein